MQECHQRKYNILTMIGLKWIWRWSLRVGDVNLVEQAAGNMWSPTIIYQAVARIWRGCVTNHTVHGVKKHSCRPPARLQLILKLITCNSIALLVGIAAASCLAYWFVRQNTRSRCLLQISVDQLQFLRYYALRFGTSPLNITLKFKKPKYKMFGNLCEHFCHAIICFIILSSSWGKNKSIYVQNKLLSTKLSTNTLLYFCNDDHSGCAV